MTFEERLAAVRPHRRQINFQSLEFYAFVHFTVNTFTGREWGDGTEAPAIFDPAELDAGRWVEAVKSAGMRGLILTCKHHDGFCLWPSKYTTHTVAYSPYKNGKGDIVGEVAEACAEGGIKFGVYISPWDRNCPKYGSGKEYDDFFVGQLTELLTGYGDIFTVWFDGACGEGPDGRKQYYDWDRYYSVIRRLQPDACINVCGPDIRWCGNEAGHTRPSEWSVVPARTRDTEKIQSESQKQDDNTFRQRKISAWDMDLGSRELLKNEPDLVWYPAEVNTSIRPGWFYHESEDDKVKPLTELQNIYINSVGGNATFLLNIPPTPRGLFHDNDTARLRELGNFIKSSFSDNLLKSAALSSDFEKEEYSVNNIREDDYRECFIPARKDCTICAEWTAPVDIGYIVIKENIELGQRVESFVIEAETSSEYHEIYRGTVIGYKRIVPVNLKADRIRIRFTESRTEPAISFLGVYRNIR